MENIIKEDLKYLIAYENILRQQIKLKHCILDNIQPLINFSNGLPRS